ncbi:hypothetical protein CLV47_11432 [Antricoccus suffuscus]|uniref:Uncharacterized protein n=2 Tax=Antricoccus suffuscus TaxID=1629062 RepID=A0A2T0ZWJ4_9ACTN|nr:hypothetical protein CLV47_11432 [Antricoccus suffuscus]
MAAIANAEAVNITGAPPAGAIETSPVGVGSTEVARRMLTHADVHAILETEVAEREQAAEGYASRGSQDQADRLRAEATAIRDALAS